MSVLVISIVMVAMAPVITKRVSDNISVANVAIESRLFLPTPSMGLGAGSSCSVFSNAEGLITAQGCSFVVPENVYSINAILVGSGTAGRNADAETVVHRTKVFTADTTFELPKYIRNLKISYMTGGGGAGSKAYSEELSGEPQSQEDCDAYNAYYVDKINSGLTENVCFTRYNVGDAKGPAISSTAYIARAASNLEGACPYDTSSSGCCWKGATTVSATYSTTGTKTDYNGRNRTICDYVAAKNSCEEFGTNFKLPNEEQLYKIGTNNSATIGYVLFYGEHMNLCSGASNISVQMYSYCHTGDTDYCYRVNQAGLGIKFTPCIPSLIWLSGENAGGYTWAQMQAHSVGDYIHQNFYDNSKYPSGIQLQNYHGLSARCVSSDLGTRQKARSGAGGATAPYLRDINLEYYTYSMYRGIEPARLDIKIGQGGNSNEDSLQGRGGKPTIVKYQKLRDDNWYNVAEYTVFGGNPAQDANQNANGVSGKMRESIATGICKNGTTSLPCSHYGFSGEDGNIYSALTSSALDKTPKGGAGANGTAIVNLASDHATSYDGTFEIKTVEGCATASTSADPEGFSSWCYGGGGAGGTVGYDSSSNTFTAHKGGDGLSGVVIIEYDEITPPRVGGGGAGGNMTIARNIKVTPGDTLNITVSSNYQANIFAQPSQSIIQKNGSFQIYGYSGYPQVRINAAGNIVGSGIDCNNFPDACNITDISYPGALQYGDDTSLVFGNDSDDVGSVEEIAGQSGSMGMEGETACNDNHYATLLGFDCSDRRFGGHGGASGTGTRGGCGGASSGLLIQFTDCVIDTTTKNGSAVKFATPTNPLGAEYGSAGAGGGGGGWTLEGGSTNGGLGQDGYVYIWWNKVD